MFETSSEIILEVPYNRIPQWLQARRRLDPEWINALTQLRAQVQAALSLNDEVLEQLHAPQALSSVEAAELFPSILQTLKRDGKADEFLRQMSELVDGISANPALAVAESSEKLATLIDRTIPESLAEVEMASKRAAAISRTQAKLRSKHENAVTLWLSECRVLGLTPQADQAAVRAAIVATISTKPGLIGIAAEALCTQSMRKAVDMYRAFVGFASGDPLVRHEEKDIAANSNLLPNLNLVVQHSADHAPARAVEELSVWPFRQLVICDLLELRAFLSQRLMQVAAGTECTARFHAFAFASPVLAHQCCDENDLMACVSYISAALAKLTAAELEVIRKLEEDPAFVAERVEHHMALKGSVDRAQHAFSTVTADANQAAEILTAAQEHVQRLRERAKSLRAACAAHVSAMFDKRSCIIHGIPARILSD